MSDHDAKATALVEEILGNRRVTFHRDGTVSVDGTFVGEAIPPGNGSRLWTLIDLEGEVLETAMMRSELEMAAIQAFDDEAGTAPGPSGA